MLVTPVSNIKPLTEQTIEFKGLNKNTYVEDGELRDMKNMTSGFYPSLYQRNSRGLYNLPINAKNPISMLCKKEKLALLCTREIYNGGTVTERIDFFYDGELIPEIADLAINNLMPFTNDTQMVSINTKICFFPQQIYYDIFTEEAGDLSYHKESSTIGEYNATIEETGDGQIIRFTDDDVVDEGLDFFNGLEIGDAISLQCFLTIEDVLVDKYEEISTLIMGFDLVEIDDIFYPCLIIPSESFLEFAEEGVTTGTLKSIILDKSCPELDYVMEYNNRIWGVSNAENTIYASKLGDPRNWQYFQNTSLDSYYAEQGTDGDFTGLAAYQGQLLFFKENYIHKIYGNSPSTFQVETSKDYGIEKGSSKSVAIINNSIIYKSTLGIMAYDGGDSHLISSKLGPSVYKDVVAGTDGIKYYASVINITEDGEEPIMIVCDYEKGLWHKEDNVRVRDFCLLKDKLLFICDNDSEYFVANKCYVINADNPMPQEKKIKWMAEIGPFTEYVENRKIYSKFGLRLIVEDDAMLDISISIDDGEFELIKHVENYTEHVLFVPIIPRRCDRIAIRLEGIGRCKIEALNRKFRAGTGGLL